MGTREIILAKSIIDTPDLYIGIPLNIACFCITGSGNVKNDRLGALSVELRNDSLDIEDNLGHILGNTVGGGKFVKDAVDLDAGDSHSGKRAEQYSAERVPESDSVTALKGLDDELRFFTVLKDIVNCNNGLYLYHSGNTSFLKIRLAAIRCHC